MLDEPENLEPYSIVKTPRGQETPSSSSRTLGTTLRDPVKVDRTQCPFVLRKERATPTKAYLKWAFKSTSE